MHHRIDDASVTTSRCGTFHAVVVRSQLFRDARHLERRVDSTVPKSSLIGRAPRTPRASSRPLALRNRHLLFLDALCLIASCVVAFTFRFEGTSWLDLFGSSAASYLVVTVPLRLAVFYGFGLYRRLWQHASIAETERILVAGLAAGSASALLGTLVLPELGAMRIRLPISVAALDSLFTMAAVALPRLSVRIAWWHGRRRLRTAGQRVLIAGAGEAGLITAREMFSRPELGLTPIGFVDDDLSKVGQMLLDVPVLGTLHDVAKLLERYDIAEVVIAMPSAPGSTIRQLVQATLAAGAQARTLPGLYEILSGRVSVTNIREVQIQDLLRREPIETNLDAVRALTTGRTIMVTGAGGSIGSELCRQLAGQRPGQLILLGHGENSIFEIHQELAARFPRQRIAPVIADIRDRKRIEEIIRTFVPHAVFHAAAHKHVPLMEANTIEALTNNILGTHNVVSAAAQHGVGHFVLISTDKAVHPTSIMGATKRIAEQIVQIAAGRCERPYVSVRFGNVLGSRGSVIPTFLQQIRAGGPVTVTHPDMCRYFITIPEAVQLVLQAFALGRRGEVFCLDMGAPVRIVDLARDLIQLSGLQVDQDIEIQFTGVRPGEKLFEEMFFSAEQMLATDHPKVLRARHAGLPENVAEHLDSLLFATRAGAGDLELRRLMRNLVPDFTGAPPRARTRAETPQRAAVRSVAAAVGSGDPPQITAL